MVHVEPTSKCNLYCKHCYNTDISSKNELSVKDIMEVLSQLRPNLMHDFITLSGGEFFAYKHSYELLSCLSEAGFKTRVFTNGSLIESSLLSKIISENLISEFRISLDGFRNEHENIRGKDCFGDIISLIDVLKSANINVVINTVVFETNYRSLIRFYKFLLTKNIDEWRLELPFLGGNYKKNSESLHVINKVELYKIFAELISTYLKNEAPILLDITNVFKSKSLVYGFSRFDTSSHPCNYFGNSITLKANGDIGFCPTLPLSFGNIFSSKLAKILESPKRLDFFNIETSDINDCKACRYLNICQTGCRADAVFRCDNILQKDLNCCESMEYFENLILPVYPEYLRKEIKKLLLPTMAHKT